METTDTNIRKLLQKLGEDTIYSAKGHFKACDIRRICIKTTIWLCAILNVAGLIFSDMIFCKILSGISLIGMIALLIWDSAEDKEYRRKHKQIAEKYLALHKELRNAYFLENFSKEIVEEFNKKISELNKNCEWEIPYIARILAKYAIEKKDTEVDKWFF